MKLNKEEKEKLKRMLVNRYAGNGYETGFGWNGLGGMIFDDFIDRLDEYLEDDTYLTDICNDITGNFNGSYTCSTYESAKLIAENIFEFNQAVEDMEEIGYDYKLDITETEKNLVIVLLFICDMSILALGVDTVKELEELIKNN